MPLNVSRVRIQAPIDQVWNALVNPELVKQWQYGSELTTDWQVGSAIRFRTQWQDQVFEQWGQVLEFTPFSRIRYSLFAPRPGLEDKPENYFVMSYFLSSEAAYTSLEIQQEDDRPGAQQEEPQGEENPILKDLKELLEG